MKWVREFDPAAILYAWQGGQEGGNGVCDVLTGRVNPCGKLTDTIAEDISDYPSTSNFGDLQKNYYKEDIYVGYRYFETFAKDKVLYPFGFGLSYTSFSVQASAEEKDEHTVCVKATVKIPEQNRGKKCLKYMPKPHRGYWIHRCVFFVDLQRQRNWQQGKKSILLWRFRKYICLL